jgi:hypothetical protein
MPNGKQKISDNKAEPWPDFMRKVPHGLSENSQSSDTILTKAL